MVDIDEDLIRKIVKEVLAQRQIDTPISFKKADRVNDEVKDKKLVSDLAVPEKNISWFQPVGIAKPGYSKDEVVIAVPLDCNPIAIPEPEISSASAEINDTSDVS